MNQQIIKLGVESGMLNYVEHETPRHYFLCANADEECLEKFAQSIVRECVQTLLDNTPEQFTNEAAEEDWDRGYDQAMRDCVHHIQEHFGIE